ncbi:MAG: hypothetical protein AAF149_22440 [Bacteroidota bacterium]
MKLAYLPVHSKYQIGTVLRYTDKKLPLVEESRKHKISLAGEKWDVERIPCRWLSKAIPPYGVLCSLFQNLD